jgi:hypothetical protein
MFDNDDVLSVVWAYFDEAGKFINPAIESSDVIAEVVNLFGADAAAVAADEIANIVSQDYGQ